MPQAAQRLGKLHGAFVMMVLVGLLEAEEDPARAYIQEACRRFGIDTKSLARLDEAIVEELVTVVRMRHRQAPRLRDELTDLIVTRLDAVTSRGVHPWANLRRVA